MKKNMLLGLFFTVGLFLTGCSATIVNETVDSDTQKNLAIATKQDTGVGNFQLLTDTITTEDNQLTFRSQDIDEQKTTYVYVANHQVFSQKIKNNKIYALDIEGLKEAHQINYSPKVQFVQYKEDKENDDISMFKQARYKVKE
ncbi:MULTISPECIES: hypothetical protein [Enterococcus]|uniref:hypothetical protein n=1 Tax=Enterococcus sp. AZ103 TaxID=2774628 RepID=UPI003F284BBB